MNNPFQNIDIQRLAGIESILGIDCTPEKVRIVVLKRKGNLLKRFSGKFSLVDSFSVSFDPAMSTEQRAQHMRDALVNRKIKTRYVVSTVRSMGIKIVTATIPLSVENIGEWIREQQEKLLRLPVPPDQISFQYEVIERSTGGILVEIAFVRKSDIEELRSFLSQAGVQLLALSAGARDVINLVYVDSQTISKGDIHVIHSDEKTLTIASLPGGKRVPLKITPAIDRPSASSVIADLKKGAGVTRILIAGESLEPFENERTEFYRPFGIFPEYVLAAGLAIKGFIPELSPMNFLPPDEREKNSVQISRSLFQRVALVLGSFTILLLGAQLLTAVILQKKIDRLDDEMISSNTAYTEIVSLEQQIKDLENRARGGGASLQRTRMAKVIYEIARLTPNGIRLDRLSIDTKEASDRKVVLTGYTRSHENIADFLKKLESSAICAEPRLVKTGVQKRTDPYEQSPAAGREEIHFEITAVVR